MSTIKTLTGADVLAGLKSAVESATLGRETQRTCSYVEYEWNGERYAWQDLPDSAYQEFNEDPRHEDYLKAREGWRHEHAVAPHCIAGVILTNQGVPVSNLSEWEDIRIGGISNTYLRKFGFAFDEDARDMLELAQVIQDEGGYWGSALDAAIDQYEAIQTEQEDNAA